MEALENMMDKRLFQELIPLMESSSPRESLNIGRKHFQLIGLDSGDKGFISHLLAYRDWVTVALTLDLIRHQEPEQIDFHLISDFTTSRNKYIRFSAQKIIDQEFKKRGTA